MFLKRRVPFEILTTVEREKAALKPGRPCTVHPDDLINLVLKSLIAPYDTSGRFGWFTEARSIAPRHLDLTQDVCQTTSEMDAPFTDGDVPAAPLPQIKECCRGDRPIQGKGPTRRAFEPSLHQKKGAAHAESGALRLQTKHQPAPRRAKARRVEHRHRQVGA